MYSVNSATATWDIMSGTRTDNSTGSSQSVFGASFKAMLSNQSGMQDIFNGLVERFPGADVTQGKPGAGTQGTKDYFGSEEGDKVAVDENLLAAMFGNSGLAQKVEDAIANFFNSDAGTNAAQGTYSQRSISITITTVRYNVSQFDSESGDLMSAQEMMTSLQEKMNDLINRLFGKGDSVATETTEDETAEESTEAVDAAQKNGTSANPYSNYNYQSFAFSMELFYSSQMINNMGSKSQSSQFSLTAMAQGSFQNYSNSILPQEIYEALTNSSDFSGPFTSLIDGGLSGFGMKSSGFQYSQSGFSLKANSSGDLLSELMDQLFNNWKRPETAATEPTETEATDVTDETAEVPAETAAE